MRLTYYSILLNLRLYVPDLLPKVHSPLHGDRGIRPLFVNLRLKTREYTHMIHHLSLTHYNAYILHDYSSESL